MLNNISGSKMIINEKKNKPVFVVFDGLDNTGKTTLITAVINEIKSKGYSTDYVHFPSDDLVKKYFNSEKQIEKQKKEFIDALLSEIDSYYSSIKDRKDIFFIDRQIISSLLYQGNPDDIDDEMNSYIDEKYMSFFTKFDISIHEDILFFIFMEPFPMAKREITEKNKEIFDNKNEFYKKRILNLYCNVVTDKYECLNSDNVVNTSFILFDVAKTQEIRQKVIIDKIRSYFSIMI